jgi:predicted permease
MSLASIAGPLGSTLNLLLPSLFIVAAGYSLARWLGLSSAPLTTLLRYVFFPVYLFMMLEKRMSFDAFFFVVLIGGAVVLVGFLIHRNAHLVFKTQIDASVAIPNVACFSIPVFALSWGGRGLGTACAFFVGVSIAAFIIEKKNFAKLFREPWLYAAVAGILYNELRGSVPLLNNLLTPFMGATYPLLLLLLGVSLHPFEGITDINAWVTSVLRIVGGFLVALLGVTVLSVSPPIAAGAVMASIAPPATKSLSLAGSTKDTPTSRGTANVGLLVSLAAFIIILATGWSPW